MEVDSLSSTHPVSTPVEIPVHLRDMFDKSLPRYIHTLRRISANSLQDRVDEYCFLGPSVCQQEELSSAGMREDTESTPLQSEGDIDEVEVDQPNPSKAIGDVLEGKRIKKTVERFNFQRHIIPKRYIGKAENGRGVKLGDIPRINDHILKMHASDLKPLHILLFGTPGRKTSMKKDMRQFNGFNFEVDSEPYIRRRQKMLRSFHSTKLKVICKVLKLMASQEKPKMVDRILSFLNCPRIPETVPWMRKPPEKTPIKKVLTRAPPKKRELFLLNKPKKKPSKKKAKESKKKATPVKKATPDSSSNSKKATSTVTEESSDDDVPLLTFKKKKKNLSNEQLIETVQKVLKEANLEEITMKQICQKVYDTYPDLDLTPRKDYIKETVKMIASALLLVSAGNRQESVPVNTQESVPVNTQEFVPVNTQESVPVNTQESVPINTQESVPINTQESVPINTQESVPVNTQESVPVNTQESAWRTRVENTPKSVPVIMNTDGWFEVERDT